MRTIGMLLGIPESQQKSIRGHIDEGFKMDEGTMPDLDVASAMTAIGLVPEFVEYVDWRANNPGDDLMTELLNAELENEDGTTRKLTRDEVLSYVGLLNAAGNETTTRLIGWTGKVLAEHPDQRRELAENRDADPERDRGTAALRGAVTGAGAVRRRATSSTTERPCPRVRC